MQALESLTDSQVRNEITWEIAKTGKHAHIGPRTQKHKENLYLTNYHFLKFAFYSTAHLGSHMSDLFMTKFFVSAFPLVYFYFDI